MYRGREGHWGGHTHFLEKQHFCNSFYHLTSDMVHMYDLKSCQSFDLEIPKKVKSKQGELHIFFQRVESEYTQHSCAVFSTA